MSAPVSAFDRVRITPLQYSSLARKRALVKREKSAKKRSPEKETAFLGWLQRMSLNALDLVALEASCADVVVDDLAALT